MLFLQQEDVSVQLEALDILGDLLSRFGGNYRPQIMNRVGQCHIKSKSAAEPPLVGLNFISHSVWRAPFYDPSFFEKGWPRKGRSSVPKCDKGWDYDAN